jgi:formylglycine-generating enzyme required for sulfatase activity
MMLGEKKRESRESKENKKLLVPNSIAVLLILTLVVIVAKSQVIIVPGKPKPSPSPKTRKNLRPKPKVVPTPTPEPVAEPNQNTPESETTVAATPDPQVNLPKNIFVVGSFVPAKPTPSPEKKTDVAVNRPPGTEAGGASTSADKKPVASSAKAEAAPAPAPPAPPPTMVSHAFEVVTTDNRGRVLERRREFSQYFLEQVVPGINLEMLEIPGGTFLMGSIEVELEGLKRDYVTGVENDIRESLIRRLQSEAPQRLVKVKPIYMSKTEITQAQWRAIAAQPKVKRELISDPSNFKGGNRPVEKVSWEDAIEFCDRLTRVTGRKYRLPTEAEWEYAARAGTSTQFHFGDAVSADWSNFQGKLTFNSSPKGDFKQQTLPVATYGIANAFGLYDMHGNVWEWCQDRWHENYASAPADGQVWEAEKDSIPYLKVIRGGGWDSPGAELRSSARNRVTSTIRLSNLGFRVVAEMSEPAANKEAIGK